MTLAKTFSNSVIESKDFYIYFFYGHSLKTKNTSYVSSSSQNSGQCFLKIDRQCPGIKQPARELGPSPLRRAQIKI